MTLGNLKLYDIFRNDLHLPDSKALEFVTALDELSEKHVSRQNEMLATKGELLLTKSELKAGILVLKQEIHTVATRVDHLSEKMASKVDLAEAKSELKNHFLTQLVVIIGTILTIVRYALMK